MTAWAPRPENQPPERGGLLAYIGVLVLLTMFAWMLYESRYMPL